MAFRSLPTPLLRASLRPSTSLSSTSKSLIQPARAASGGPHYNQPSGRLFGEAPGPRVKEDWENIFMYGFFGGFVLFGVLYIYKPDSTVQTWALAEAKKKLQEEGGMPTYEKS